MSSIFTMIATRYKSFSSVREMNNTVHSYIELHGLEGKIKAFLHKLEHYSCKDEHTGVSFRSLANWAEEFEVNVRTVQRWVKTLCKLGITRTFEVFDSKGRQLQNIIVIQPKSVDIGDNRSENVTPTVTPENNSFTKQDLPKNKDLNRISEIKSIPLPFKNKIWVPEWFKRTLPIGSEHLSEVLWARVMLAYKNNAGKDYIGSIKEYAGELSDVVKKAIHTHFKSSKIHNCSEDGLIGFVFSAISRLFSAIALLNSREILIGNRDVYQRERTIGDIRVS
ncbi:hypothetical protein [Paenibacillus sp. MMO-58]|uniref:hypothetical protein n=1 Tax=Paenibacillus sp. MMO-58 TaxID=3081290 RepID=UPI00301A5A51